MVRAPEESRSLALTSSRERNPIRDDRTRVMAGRLHSLAWSEQDLDPLSASSRMQASQAELSQAAR